MDIKMRIVSRSSIPFDRGGEQIAGLGLREMIRGAMPSGATARTLPADVMQEISDRLYTNVRITTKSGYDAQGYPFTAISEKYAKYKQSRLGASPIADLYAHSSAKGPALDNMQFNRIGRSNSVRATFDYADQEKYMTAHQFGEWPQPERRFLPEEGDFSSGPHARTKAEIDAIIKNYFDDMMRRKLGG